MMKNLYLHAVYICFIAIFYAFGNPAIANNDGCDSVNVDLNSKFRFLGDWQNNGKPNYLEVTGDDVSQDLINYVVNTLPESVNLPNSNDEYFGDDVQLNTELNEASEVYLTMVHEGAGWKNSLGYYTYDVNDPPQTVYDIDSLVILFPNVSQPGVISPGDKILLGEFPENTGIGYFLIAKGWVGDTICLTSHIVFSDPHLNTFTTPEYQQQTVLLNYEREEQLLLCFEDIMRPAGDNDFNDAVFYVTAAPGAIDTTDIPKIPTAHISGDTTLCEISDPATIKVELTGQAPWTIVYDNGKKNIKIEDIEDEVITFETSVKDTIKLVSVRDKNKLGIVSGEAIVQLSEPKAIIDENQPICGVGEENNGYIVTLEGHAPFTLSFRVGDEEKTIEDIQENQFEVRGDIGKEIELLWMNDRYCEGEVVGGAIAIQNIENPGFVIDGNGAVCGEAITSTFELSLTGEGPWVLDYSLNGDDIQLPIETNQYSLEVEANGLLTFNSLSDENCVALLNSTFSIENKPVPAASVSDHSNFCGEDEASINIKLTGEGPWTIYYEINDERLSAESNEENMVLSIAESGSFELIGVSDSNCDGSAEGTLDLELTELPTALISGDTTLCPGGIATVNIEMTGIAPFTLVYTDGTTDIELTTRENSFEFETEDFATYTLMSIDDAFCSGTVDGSAVVSDGSEDIQVEIDTEPTSCFGEDIALSLLGETDDISVLWTTEGQGQFSSVDALETTYTPAEGEAGIVLFYAEVNNGCATETISAEVTIVEELDATFDLSPDEDLLANTQITFTPTNSEFDEYIWDFGDGNTSQATIASNEYIEGDTYEVKLVVSYQGCESEYIKEIEVLAKDELYIPNAFNPDAMNPENQVVKVYGNNIDENEFAFKIVNRWGKIMYHTRSFAEANTVGWNGVNRNNSEQLELNVFTYVVKGKFLDGDSFEKTGTITQVK